MSDSATSSATDTVKSIDMTEGSEDISGTWPGFEDGNETRGLVLKTEAVDQCETGLGSTAVDGKTATAAANRLRNNQHVDIHQETIVPSHHFMNTGSMRIRSDPDGAQTAAINSLLNITSVLDAHVILQAIAPKLFDSLSIWDIMMQKAHFGALSNAKFGIIPLLVDDMERVLLEMKLLIESVMYYDPNGVKAQGRRKLRMQNALLVNDLVGTALCIETGLWRRKGLSDIQYAGLAEKNLLFPTSGVEPEPPNSKRTTSNVNNNISTAVNQSTDDAGVEMDDETSDVYYDKPNYEEYAMDEEEEDEFVDDGARDLADDDDFKIHLPLRKPNKARRSNNRLGVVTPQQIKTEDDVTNFNVADAEDVENRRTTSMRKMRLKFKQDKKNFFCKFPDCPSGEVPFKNRGDFEAHFLDAHMTSEHRVIPCLMNGCEEKFALTSERNAHMASTHSKDFSCVHCDRKFFREQDLEDHVRRCHIIGGMAVTKVDNFDPTCVCTKCGKKFASRAYVDSHEKSCDGLFVRQPNFTLSRVKNLYFCQEPNCDVITPFESEYSLRMHFYDVHLREEEKIFVCEYCNLHFALRTLLNKHINASHDKKHQCTFCGKRFGGRDKLRSHIFTHTGEKPYACDKCDYRAAKKYNLDQHKQSKHQDFGIKSHYCELCGKGFVTQGRVRQHKKIIHKEGRINGKRRQTWVNIDGTAAPVGLMNASATSEDGLLAAAAAAADSALIGGPGATILQASVDGGCPQQVVNATTVDGQTVVLQPDGVTASVAQSAAATAGGPTGDFITTDLAEQTGVIVGLRY